MRSQPSSILEPVMNDVLAKHKRVNLHVEDTGGDGRPVVLVHDWPLTLDQWKLQVPSLRSAGYRVISYDRRGFGRSEKPSEGYSYDETAADLAALIVDMQLTNVSLVGFGMGAAEAVRAEVLLGGEGISHLLLVSTLTPYMLRSDANPNGWLHSSEYVRMLQALHDDRGAFFTELMKAHHSVNGELKISLDQLEDLVRMCQTSDQTAAMRCLESVCRTDHRSELAAVGARVTILHGTEDAFAPVHNAAYGTRWAMHNGLNVDMKGAPHGVNISNANEFNEALLRLLPT